MRRDVMTLMVTYATLVAALAGMLPDASGQGAPPPPNPQPCYSYGLSVGTLGASTQWISLPMNKVTGGFWLYTFKWDVTFGCGNADVSFCQDCLYVQVEYLGADGVSWFPVPGGFAAMEPSKSPDCSGGMQTWYQNQWGQIGDCENTWTCPKNQVRFSIYGANWAPGGDGSCSVGNQSYSLLASFQYSFPFNQLN